MELHAYTAGSLQDARSLVIEARREGLSLVELQALLDRAVPAGGAVLTAARRVSGSGRGETVCPSCGRFVMVQPRGVSEPVLVCPSCRYSEYRG